MFRNIPKNADWCAKFVSILGTFDVSFAEVQLLDLPGPRHGRQHLESILTVDLGAADVELEESTERLEVLELAYRMEANQKVSGIFRKVRTGAQRRAQEISFDVCSPSMFLQSKKPTLVRFGQLLSTWMLPVRMWCSRFRGCDSAQH